MDESQVEKFRYIGAIGNVENFDCWQDQWELGVNGLLFQEGVMLNQVFGYEEAFGWHLVKDQPFFSLPKRTTARNSIWQPGFSCLF